MDLGVTGVLSSLVRLCLEAGQHTGAASPAELVVDDHPGDDDTDRDGRPAPGAPARLHQPMVAG